MIMKLLMFWFTAKVVERIIGIIIATVVTIVIWITTGKKED